MENLGSFLREADARLTSQLNSYSTIDYNWIYVDDTNGGTTYSSNFVNFDRINIKSSTLNEVYHMSEAFIALRWSEHITLTNAQFKHATRATYTTLKSDASGVISCSAVNDGATSIAFGTNVATTTSTTDTVVSADRGYTGREIKYKGLHHFVDNIQFDLGSAVINRNTPFLNLLNELELKKLRKDEYEKISDTLEYTCEDTDFKICKNGNNALVGGRTIKKTNERDDKRNRALVSYPDLFNESTTNNLLRVKKTLISVSDNVLIYDCFQLVPLKYIYSIFGVLPSVLNIESMRLQLQMNMNENNYSEITYANTLANTKLGTVDEFLPTAYTTMQSTGRTCPFYLGKVSWRNESDVDLVVTPTNNTEFKVKVELKLNYGASAPNGEKLRLYIPYTVHNSLDFIKNQSMSRILYNDLFQDVVLNVGSNQTVSRKFNFEVAKPRFLFILPFVRSNVSGTDLAELVNPLFNGGVEVSPYDITDLQIQINSNPIFKKPLKYKWEFYEYYKMYMGENTDGNPHKSENMSGLVSFDMYQKTHGVMAIDLKKALGEQLDASTKSIQIEFTNRAKSGVSYDYLFLVSSQFEISLDRVTGGVRKI